MTEKTQYRRATTRIDTMYHSGTVVSNSMILQPSIHHLRLWVSTLVDSMKWWFFYDILLVDEFINFYRLFVTFLETNS